MKRIKRGYWRRVASMLDFQVTASAAHEDAQRAIIAGRNAGLRLRGKAGRRLFGLACALERAWESRLTMDGWGNADQA